MSLNNHFTDKQIRPEITRLQQQLFAEGVVSRQLLDTVPTPLLIINKQWQVVYANGAVMTLIGTSDTNPRPGLREGEAFHCVHFRQHKKDSISYQSCRVCGIARLLSRSLKGEEVCEDCHLTCDLTEPGASLDLRVWATPLEFHGEHFSILSLLDISDRRRRKLLEKACYHDLLNTLTSIRGVLSVVKAEKVDDQDKIFTLLEKMTQDSIDEIDTLRLLEKAEQRELAPQPSKLSSGQFLALMRDTFIRHPAANGKTLIIDGSTINKTIVSDYHLLRRIIGNMLVNALEATDLGGKVVFGCRPEQEGILFWVHNEKMIPLEIQDQIFFHNVTDKGHNRGIGTYSIRLLSSLLGGQAGFKSTALEGTTFSVWLPCQYSQQC